MFDTVCQQEHNPAAMQAGGTVNTLRKSGRFATVLTPALMAVLPLTAMGQTPQFCRKNGFAFVNAVDNTQGTATFGSAPAINSAGAVAFESSGSGFPLGSVRKWQNGCLTNIATSADNIIGTFGDTVTINSSGTVGFSAKVLSNNDAFIATGDGGALSGIVSANAQGLVGGGFLGISSMNERGTVSFLGLRRGSGSSAVFVGRGGSLSTIVETATNPSFSGLGNSAIDASGNVVFLGFLADGNEGLFLSSGGSIKAIVDTATTPTFIDFLDPVINENGTIGSAAFLSAGGMQVFTATAAGVTPRTDGGPFFTSVDNVSINNRRDVAFFATTAAGGAGVFAELTGGSDPIPVIETGDSLFGSTVVAVSMGRFSLNDHRQIAFQYRLEDGRIGIAVASRQH